MNPSDRHVVSLDGVWNLDILDGHRNPVEKTQVQVPGPWTTQVAGHGDSHQTVVYAKEFAWSAPRSQDTAIAEQDSRYFLMFGGVNYHAQVSINGHVVGEHTGSWTPFEFEVTQHLRTGLNTVRVEVSYPPVYGTDEEIGFLEVPHGKQSWYGTTAGIWQSVTLERRNKTFFTNLVVTADPHAHTINAAVNISGPIAPEAKVWATAGFAGAQVTTRVAPTIGPDGQVHLEISVPNPHLWSLDTPNLYDVQVLLGKDHTIYDSVSKTTGFRTFVAKDGNFYLNGQEIEIRAVLDQDYHPNSSSIPESTEALEQLFLETRKLGFNMLRVHIKRPDHRYYDLADKLGILVWTELPSWLTWTEQTARDGVALLEHMIGLDDHHPSIVAWTIINESWGLDLKSAKQRDWLVKTFDRIKQATPHTLVVDNSACLPNYHLKTDIDDYHLYRGIPESRNEWDTKIAEFAARPDWSFSPHGDAQRTGQEPLMLSEFGNWALPYALDQYGPQGQEPWWFVAGQDWAFGAAEGTNLIPRFEALGLDQVFGSWPGLVTALHRVQMIANRYQTGSIRMKPELSGYVLTQLSDVQWEANGLFDAQRTPKQFNADFGLINGDHAVIVRPSVYSGYENDAITAAVTVPTPRAPNIDLAAPAHVRVMCGTTLVETIAVDLTTWPTCEVKIALPHTTQQVELAAELWVNEALVARDAADILVVSRHVPEKTPTYFLDADCQSWLTLLGYQPLRLTTTSPTSGTLVVTVFDDQAQEFARDGGNVLVLAEHERSLGNAIDFLPSARLGSRTGDGDWVPRNEWLARTGPFATIPGDTILGIAFEDLLGDLVINGIPNAMRPAHVYSGIFSGWLRGTATTTATIKWSEGTVTLTTLKVRQQAGQTPIATALSHALLSAVGGAEQKEQTFI